MIANLDDHLVKQMCQELIEAEEYSTLANLINTSSRVHRICQEILLDVKQQEDEESNRLVNSLILISPSNITKKDLAQIRDDFSNFGNSVVNLINEREVEVYFEDRRDVEDVLNKYGNTYKKGKESFKISRQVKRLRKRFPPASYSNTKPGIYISVLGGRKLTNTEINNLREVFDQYGFYSIKRIGKGIQIIYDDLRDMEDAIAGVKLGNQWIMNVY